MVRVWCIMVSYVGIVVRFGEVAVWQFRKMVSVPSVIPLCSDVSLFRRLCIPNVCMKNSGRMGAYSNLTFSITLT